MERRQVVLGSRMFVQQLTQKGSDHVAALFFSRVAATCADVAIGLTSRAMTNRAAMCCCR
jgi:hypothetical protein